MHKTKIKNFFFLFFFCFLFCNELCSELFFQRFLKLKKTESKIELHGKLVDQFGEPIKNAKVCFRTESYGLIHPVYATGTVQSDEAGCFEIHKERGGILYIEDVVASGYEFRQWGNDYKTYFDFRTSRRDRHRPDKENPVVFRLRKRLAHGTYLLKKSFIIGISAKAKFPCWARDLDKGWNINPRRKMDPEVFWDIEVYGIIDMEKKQWRLTFKTNGLNSGIQRQDGLLYEAPENGYGKALDVVLPFSRPLPLKHLYVRLREPGMYARFDISPDSFANEEHVQLFVESFINPYGDRSFEELLRDSKREYERFGQCSDDAEQAFREQRFAPRPNFEEWIREGKARY